MRGTAQQFIDCAHAMVAQGNGEGARRLMNEAAGTMDLEVRRAAGLLLAQYGHYGEPGLSCLTAVAAALPEDPQVLRALATFQWVGSQRDPSRIEALETARRLVSITPEDVDALCLLGMIALNKRAYLEGYLAFTAAAKPTVPLEPQRRLATRLMRGIDHVMLRLDGVIYDFGLAIHTTQAMESSIVHCAGLLTEIEELRYLKTILGQADVIVEVGVLLANHSAFFLQNLAPKRLYLFEADPTMLPEIRRNTAANNKGGTEVRLQQAFVGAEGGAPIEVHGAQLPQRSLSNLVNEHVDFLKVDTDGGELPFLDGAEELIMTSRPLIMMETDTVTDGTVQEWFAFRGYTLRHRIGHGHYFNNFFAPVS